jgi:hypothetical protein
MTLINALPDDDRVEEEVFNLQFLQRKGYFGMTTENIDQFAPGKKVTYLFNDKTAYFEGIDLEVVSEIVEGLRKKRNFEYYWFWQPEEMRLEVLRTWGDNKQFIYNPAIHKGGTRSSKVDKLSNIDTREIAYLFDIKAVADRFYNELWDHRLNLAKCLQTETEGRLSDKEALLTAQRTIDRLIFTYFLMNKGIIQLVLPNGEVMKVNPQAMFTDLADETADFSAFLNSLFFDYLGDGSGDEQVAAGPTAALSGRQLAIGDTEKSLVVPYLNGGLFRARSFDGSETDAEASSEANPIYEDNIEADDFDWKSLVTDLSQYNWILDDYSINGDLDREIKGTLTPEILGSIYERFVITVSEIDDLTLDDLRDRFQGDVEQMRKGNRDIGAYYTPEDIVEKLTTECLWSYLQDTVPATRDYDSFDVFFEDVEAEAQLSEVDKALSHVTVCDPAVGSGHFLMAIGDKIEDWRLKCGSSDSLYELRTYIVLENLYGVDVLEGATDICQLRMWLWLVAGQDLGTFEDSTPTPLSNLDNQVDIDPLPNIDYNIRTGNSLIGFASNAVSPDGLHDFLPTQGLEAQIEEYSEKVDRAKRTHQNIDRLSAEVERLHMELESEVNEKFVQFLNSVAEVEDDPRKIHFENADDFREIVAGESNATYVYMQSKQALPEELNTLFPSDYKNTAKGEIDPDDYVTLADSIDLVDPDEWNEAYVRTTFDHAELRGDGQDPIHWIIEFPDEFTGEEPGFDIVLGNPPYGHKVLSDNETEWLKHYASVGCGDICGFFVERQNELLRKNGIFANIIAASLVANMRMTPVREYMRKTMSDIKLSYFGTRPAKIFDNVEERVSIAFGRRGDVGTDGIYSSKNIRFTAEQRTSLFESIDFGYADDLRLGNKIGGCEPGDNVFLPKVGPEKSREILLMLKQLSEDGRLVEDVESDSGPHRLEFRETAGYWLHALREFPYSNSKINELTFDSATHRDISLLLINSSLFYFYFATYGNNRDVYKPYVQHFPFPPTDAIDAHENDIRALADQLDEDLQRCFNPDVGRNGQFDNASIRETIDACDELLGSLYGFSDKTVAYLQSYDRHIRPGKK